MKNIKELLSKVYDQPEVDLIVNGIEELHKTYKSSADREKTSLTEKDVVLITYGDQVYTNGESKLQTLNKLLKKELIEEISIVHILPFYPYTSDDGFSVVDYYAVDPSLGSWDDIEKLSENFSLLFDAVINHSSQECDWFKKFLNDEEPYENYYVEMDDPSAYKNVVRPRTSPLSHSYESGNGTKEVWSTFSKDQVDLNFKDPKVFLQIMDLLLFYISKGAKIIRLDAIGFMWKEKNTTCIHLPQTHLLIKTMRKVIEELPSSAFLLTETNVPHLENISYFGNGDEAHMVYNFTLPPLLAFSILSGNTKKLSDWIKTLKLENDDTCFFNFLASHDGVGVRPVHDILNDNELKLLIDSAEASGGRVSYKSNPDGKQSPYEINCNYFSLLNGKEKSESLGEKRTILAHAFILTMPGLPAIYFHSMFGSKNDLDGMEKSGINRRINREKLEYNNLMSKLNDPSARQSRILSRMKEMIRIRKIEPAFNPYSSFKVDTPADGVISLDRTSEDAKSVIKSFFNLSNKKINISLDYSEKKKDLLTGKTYEKNLELDPLEFLWLKIR